MGMGTKIVLGSIGALVFFYWLGGRAKEEKASSAPTAEAAPARPTPPVESDHDYLLRTTKREAKYDGEELIKKFLKAPTQAKFSDRELVEQLENFALVSMTVDAPNSFGVMLRQRWCAILSYNPPRGKGYTYSKSMGAWDCSDGLDKKDLLIRKMTVGWPGAREEAKQIIAAEKQK